MLAKPLHKRIMAIALAALLSCQLLMLASREALAAPSDKQQVSVEEAQATLDDAQTQMNKISEEYNDLSDEVKDLQKQIDETATSALEAQQAMLEGRDKLGDVARGEYRNDTTMGLVTLIFDSNDFDELLRNVEYVTQVMSYQAEEVAAQKERKKTFDEINEQLNDQKAKQEKALAAQEEKLAEAQKVVDNAESQLQSAQEEHARRLAEIAAQAEALQKQRDEESKAAERAEDPNANTTERESVVSDDEPVQADPADEKQSTSESKSGSDSHASESKETQKSAQSNSSESSSSLEASSSSDSSSEEGWLSGTASAYGGSSDPSTPNPGTTATGAVCDDNSMGVAVPKSMPNYRSYYGRTVEISYGGKTVYATVNDCGNMGGGSRVLDLQPGVFKALGYSSCKAWGLRTVKYRFL